MGHEYIHVYFYTGGALNEISQDRVAYKWNENQAKAWGMDYSHYTQMYNECLGKTGAAPHPYGLRVGFQKIRPERPW